MAGSRRFHTVHCFQPRGSPTSAYTLSAGGASSTRLLLVASAHAGVNVNDITDEGRLDRLTGNAAFSAVPVTIAAVDGA